MAASGHTSTTVMTKEIIMTSNLCRSKRLSDAANFCVIAALFCQAHSPALASDVLTQHNNAQRTGAVLDETQLNTNNVTGAKFGKLWSLYADGQESVQSCGQG
jgi:hypothetical protein